jgi:hypothetical protein
VRAAHHSPGGSSLATPPRVWRPVPSAGPALGFGIALLALGCTLILLGADLATASSATRVLCSVGAVIGAGTFLVAALGTWWCATLRYALGSTALEVRYGWRRLRLRYDEIDEVAARTADEPRAVPTLWPGAHLGRVTDPLGRPEVWRATTTAPDRAVIVSAAGAGHVVTPSDVGSFREALIESARSAPYVGSPGTWPRPDWIDLVAKLDAGVRGLLLAAGLVATAGIALDVARAGATQRDGMAAATILLANGIAALGLSIRWPIVGRLLAAGALAAQVLALF